MKTLEILQKHPLLDLIRLAFFRARCGIDRIWSTALFQLKCCYHGIGLGSGAQVWGKVCFYRFPSSKISIGKNVRIVTRPYRYALNCYPQAKLSTFLPSARILIGDNVGFNATSITARSKTIQIGNGTIIGANTQIMDTDWHPLWPPETRTTYPGDEHDVGVEIGRNVFIGINVLVLKGVTIGDNSVIGAGSVVSRSIPANVMAAGVPAKVLRKLGES